MRADIRMSTEIQQDVSEGSNDSQDFSDNEESSDSNSTDDLFRKFAKKRQRTSILQNPPLPLDLEKDVATQLEHFGIRSTAMTRLQKFRRFEPEF